METENLQERIQRQQQLAAWEVKQAAASFNGAAAYARTLGLDVRIKLDTPDRSLSVRVTAPLLPSGVDPSEPNFQAARPGTFTYQDVADKAQAEAYIDTVTKTPSDAVTPDGAKLGGIMRQVEDLVDQLDAALKQVNDSGVMVRLLHRGQDIMQDDTRQLEALIYKPVTGQTCA